MSGLAGFIGAPDCGLSSTAMGLVDLDDGVLKVVAVGLGGTAVDVSVGVA